MEYFKALSSQARELVFLFVFLMMIACFVLLIL